LSGEVVIIGLGNVFLHDDGVGIRVAEALKHKLKPAGPRSAPQIRIEEYEEMDLSLLQEIQGAMRLIVVDSMKSGTDPGTVSVFRLAENPRGLESMPSLHELDLSDMVYLAQSMGVLDCPVFIVGIEPEDLSVGEGLSERVEGAIPRAVEAVVSRLGAEGEGEGH
jgi:hydrogenase maturation protease